jgi:sulfite exporter TauE/SafE
MIELPLVFAAGILGTGHCLGMCGPFALAIGSGARSTTGVFGRQAAYTAGRVFTYGVLGCAAGYCGSRLNESLPTIVNVPALLAIAAGLVLVYQGLASAGWLPVPAQAKASGAACLAGSIFGRFLRQPGAGGVFLAGLFTGLLPCGLLYGMLALASSTDSPPSGALAMVVFGLGTAPGMVLAGASGRLIGLKARRRLYAAAAWCLVLTGLISVGRGAMFLTIGERPAAGCPACRPPSPLVAR